MNNYNNCLEKLSEFNKLNLTNLGKITSFTDFQKVISNKNNIESLKNLILSLNNYRPNLNINPKIIFTSYLITFYTDDIIQINDMNILDKKIIELSKKLIETMETTNINDIWNHFNEYAHLFPLWINMDKERTIEQSILCYSQLEEHIKIIKSEKKINFEQQIDMLQELERQKKEIIISIKLTDKLFDTEFLKKNHASIVEHIRIAKEKLHIQLANNMKKAYYDMIHDDINNNEFMSTFNLIQDIGNRYIVLCPENKKESFKNKFSDEKILDMLVNISNNEFSVPIINFIIFMVDFIIIMDAPVNDSMNKTWKEEVLSLFSQPLSKALPQILIQIQEHIDNVYSMIAELQK
jgi:hypothetical protein